MLTISRLLEVPIISRPCLNAFLEAQLSSALFEGSKKRQVVFTNCREAVLKFDFREETQSGPTAHDLPYELPI